jgi:ABC-type transporter MlaC component
MIRQFAQILLVAAALAAPFAAVLPATANPDVAQAQQFITDGVLRTAKILRRRDRSRAEIAADLRVEFRRGFDVATIANFVLGPARDQLSREQKRLYMREFEELIVQTYTNRVIYFGPRVKSDISDIFRFTGHRMVKKDQIILYSQINREGADWVKINWRLRERKGRLAIIDITLLGISQAQLYRSEIAAVIKRNGRGADGLIDALRAKTAEIRKGKVTRATSR